MYTLRKINKRLIFNKYLGDTYTYIKKFNNPDDFNH